jgi:hypothetical protein
VAQNTLLRLLLKCHLGELYRKPLLTEGDLLLVGGVVEQSSHGLKPHMALYLRLHLAFGSEKMYIKTAAADKIQDCTPFTLPQFSFVTLHG